MYAAIEVAATRTVRWLTAGGILFAVMSASALAQEQATATHAPTPTPTPVIIVIITECDPGVCAEEGRATSDGTILLSCVPCSDGGGESS